MTMPQLREHTLAELSRIKVRYFVVEARNKPFYPILVVRYSGIYAYGSAGNNDAQYMYAMASAGVAAFAPWGLIHDCSELRYDWGDRLDSVFGAGLDDLEGGLALVVGPACEEAIRTLLLGLNSSKPLDSLGWVFRDLAAAWEFVSAR
ncbi:MAG: hypothetical protein MUD01_15460 [Chloroflexaceae bacterium]|jgi:hypothetical protein|nr:hypothetical protein [Chloroflexaceae bacterium]